MIENILLGDYRVDINLTYECFAFNGRRVNFGRIHLIFPFISESISGSDRDSKSLSISMIPMRFITKVFKY